MWVHRTPEGVFVHDAAVVEKFSLELLNRIAKDEPGMISVDAGVITIKATNGTWRYRIDPSSDDVLMVTAVVVDHEQPTKGTTMPERDEYDDLIAPWRPVGISTDLEAGRTYTMMQHLVAKIRRLEVEVEMWKQEARMDRSEE